WYEVDSEYFRKDTGADSYLMVCENDDTGLWTIERMTERRLRGVHADEILVFTFGWTPLLTRSNLSGMCLADHSYQMGTPAGLSWVKAVAGHFVDALDVRKFVERRSNAEALLT